MTRYNDRIVNQKRLKQISTFLSNPLVLMMIAALIGIIYYISIFGLYTINPFNTSWLLYNSTGSDISQHYLGWSFFRQEAWGFPLGVIHSLAYPSGVPITFLDSIPLVALPLKIFNGLLPTDFQYFGIWAVTCYALQGMVGVLIFRHWTKNPYVQILGAIFLISAPVLAARTLAHTALGSQWIILVSILLLIEYKRFNIKQYTVLWSSLYIVAVLVHPYFLPMISLPFIISIVLSHRKWIVSFVKLVIPPLSSLLVFWVIGGLYLGKDVNMHDDLGVYGLNLDFLFSSGGWSRVVGTLPGPGEGYVYFGLGILMLLPVCLYLFITKSTVLNLCDARKKIKLHLRVRNVLVAIAVIGLFIAAVSPHVMLGSHVIYDIHLPYRIYEWWSTFRATARLFWPIYYMIIVFSLAYVIVSFKKEKTSVNTIAIFLAIVCSVQVIDIYTSPIMKLRKQEFEVYRNNRSSDGSDVQKYMYSLIHEQKHMVVVDPISVSDFYFLAPIALKSDMTLNTGYFARTPTAKIKESQLQARAELIKRKANVNDNFYVIIDKSFTDKLKELGYTVEQVGNYYVIN